MLMTTSFTSSSTQAAVRLNTHCDNRSSNTAVSGHRLPGSAAFQHFYGGVAHQSVSEHCQLSSAARSLVHSNSAYYYPTSNSSSNCCTSGYNSCLSTTTTGNNGDEANSQEKRMMQQFFASSAVATANIPKRDDRVTIIANTTTTNNNTTNENYCCDYYCCKGAYHFFDILSLYFIRVVFLLFFFFFFLLSCFFMKQWFWFPCFTIEGEVVKIMNFSLQMMKVPSPSFHHYRLMVRMVRKMVSFTTRWVSHFKLFPHLYLPDHFVFWHSTSTCLSIRSRPNITNTSIG